MKVSLFIPCLTDQLFPTSGMNMVKVLERVGVSVSYDPKQTCCGQPAFNTGYHHESVILAMRFLDIFGDAEYVVAPSGSCTTMAKVFYGELEGLPDGYCKKAEQLRPRLFELTQFLVDVMHLDSAGGNFPYSVTVHDSCHALRELGIKDQPRKLLRNVKGLTLLEMDQSETCCGFGGTFAVKYASISTAMAKEKADAVMASGADIVTGVDSSCLMNIEGMLKRRGSGIRSMHIADILAT